MSKQRVDALVSASCHLHKERASRLDEVTRDLSTAENGWAFCRGQLDEARREPPQRTISPTWVRVSLNVLAPVLGASGGACVGVGCPVELSAVLVTASVAAIVARLVLEYIDGL